MPESFRHVSHQGRKDMTKFVKATAFAFLAVALCVQALPAQEQTGEIEGTVTDNSGEALPGVTIEAKGPLGTQIAVTDSDGDFRFPRLRSGVYTLTATLEGFAISEGQVDIGVGEVQTVNFEMASASVTEEIVVVGENVGIDLGSSSTTTSISRERIEIIPRGRDFADVAAQAAGASDESQAGGISIDGSSGAENRFVIDGIDTTSPQEGINSVPMRADFIEEVQVKSAGYAAEYGGSTGGVINAVTKSGGNDWSFGVLAQYEDMSIGGGSQRRELNDSLTTDGAFVYSNNKKDDETRIDPGFFIGGPIVKDKLWFFGSYQPGIRDRTRTVDFAFSRAHPAAARRSQHARGHGRLEERPQGRASDLLGFARLHPDEQLRRFGPFRSLRDRYPRHRRRVPGRHPQLLDHFDAFRHRGASGRLPAGSGLLQPDTRHGDRSRSLRA
jgi:hypothetical protein